MDGTRRNPSFGLFQHLQDIIRQAFKNDSLVRPPEPGQLTWGDLMGYATLYPFHISTKFNVARGHIFICNQLQTGSAGPAIAFQEFLECLACNDKCDKVRR